MTTMMAAMYYGKGDIRLEQVPRPVPGPGEVLMRVYACGICGSDSRTYQKGSPPGNLPVPRVLGHEFAGTVAELGRPQRGAGVMGFAIGERVTAAPANECGHCFYCTHGVSTLCSNVLDFGTTQFGAQAEYLLIPAPLVAQGGLIKLPADTSYDKACMAEPLGTCLHGLRTRGGLQPGETVVVVGDGAIGLLQVMLARHLGARAVICAGHHAERLEFATRHGATLVVNTNTQDLAGVVREQIGGIGADLIMVSVPNPQALQDALPLVRGGGRLVVFGGLPKGSKIEIEQNLIHYGELTVTGSFNCTVEEFRQALQIARDLPVEELISHRVPLAHILDGYKLMADKAGMKVLVVM